MNINNEIRNIDIYELAKSKKNMNFLGFEISADYGHFRKYYTTSSPLTFSVIPRTALIGIISAIIGIPKDEFGKNSKKYFELMDPKNTILALKIINPIKKIRIAINLLDCKEDGTRTNIFKDISKLKEPIKIARTQVNTEFLKNPKYKVFISIEDKNYYQDLKYKLENRLSVYTPYMGLSFCLLNFKYIGEYEILDLKTNYKGAFDTIIDIENIEDIELENKFYLKEKVSYLMDESRKTILYKNFLFEADAQSIKATLKNALALKDKKTNEITEISIF